MESLKQGFVLLLLFGIFMVAGCRSMQLVNKYQYFDVGINDLPPVEEVEAILIMNYYHPELAEIMLAVGEEKTIEKIIGHEIFPKRMLDDTLLLHRLFVSFKNAKRVNRGCIDDARAVFITQRRAYMIPIGGGADEKIVFGPDYESEQLKIIFNELGID